MRFSRSRSVLAALGAVASTAAGFASSSYSLAVADDCHRPAPAFFWSATPLSIAGREFGGPLARVQDAAALEGRNLAEALLEAAAKGAGAPDVIVLMVSQGAVELSTTAVAAAAAARAVPHCQSAHAVLPYVYPSAELPSRVFASGCAKAGLVLTETIPAGLPTALTAAVEAAVAGKPRAFIVVVPEGASVAEVDSLLGEAWAALTAATASSGAKNGAALAFVADRAADGCGRGPLLHEARQRRRLESTTATTARTIQITPDILTGILFLLLFLFLLLSGFSCLNEIEYPKTFVHSGPPAGREY